MVNSVSLFESENSRHRDVCFSKVLVCLFKVQKRLVFIIYHLAMSHFVILVCSIWYFCKVELSFFKSDAKVLLFFDMTKSFYMFYSIFQQKISNFAKKSTFRST